MIVLLCYGLTKFKFSSLQNLYDLLFSVEHNRRYSRYFEENSLRPLKKKTQTFLKMSPMFNRRKKIIPFWNLERYEGEQMIPLLA